MTPRHLPLWKLATIAKDAAETAAEQAAEAGVPVAGLIREAREAHVAPNNTKRGAKAARPTGPKKRKLTPQRARYEQA